MDVLISPEQVVTNYIKRLIEHPGALQVIDFAEGKAQLVGIKAYYGGPLVGRSCASCASTCRTGYPRRRDLPPQPADHSPGRHGDRGRRRSLLHRRQGPYPRGNGEMRRLDDSQADHHRRRRQCRRAPGRGHREPLPGKDHRAQPLRCRHLGYPDSTIVLNGSASDRDLLLEENIGETDVFLALTNDDEANIMFRCWPSGSARAK